MSKQTKQLGSWGLVVALIGSLLGVVIPFVGILVLLGWIAVVVGYIKASDELGEPQIKSNVIKAVVSGILALVVFVAGGGAMAFSMASQMRGGDGMNMGAPVIVVMVAAWLMGVLASWFWYKANSHMAERTGINLFKTGGLLMFAGTILALIMIGGLVSLVGEILLIVAWFGVQEERSDVEVSQS